MKRTVFSIVWIAILVLVLQEWRNESHPETQQNLSALSNMKITISSPKAKPKLTPQQAKAITDKFSPYGAAQAKKVIVEYQLVTQTNRPDPLNRVPCYIVSYEGLHEPSHQGIPGGPISPPHNEINFIIDANTGKILLIFDYR